MKVKVTPTTQAQQAGGRQPTNDAKPHESVFARVASGNEASRSFTLAPRSFLIRFPLVYVVLCVLCVLCRVVAAAAVAVVCVQEMLAEKTGVHKDQIRLIFKGKPMADEKVSRRHTHTHGQRTDASEQMRARAQQRREAERQRTSMHASSVTAALAPISSPLLLCSLPVQTLADQQVVAGSTVHMIMQMRGGC